MNYHNMDGVSVPSIQLMAMHATNKLIVSGNSWVYNKGKEYMTQRAGESGLLL